MNFVEISSKIHYALRRAQEMLNHFHFIKKLAQNVSTGNDTIYEFEYIDSSSFKYNGFCISY